MIKIAFIGTGEILVTGRSIAEMLLTVAMVARTNQTGVHAVLTFPPAQ
tara:strand:- start:724 stop:867 length:144 start_codon:yes stop_codon:yes gene_type:complete